MENGSQLIVIECFWNASDELDAVPVSVSSGGVKSVTTPVAKPSMGAGARALAGGGGELAGGGGELAGGGGELTGGGGELTGGGGLTLQGVPSTCVVLAAISQRILSSKDNIKPLADRLLKDTSCSVWLAQGGNPHRVADRVNLIVELCFQLADRLRVGAEQ